MQAHFEWAVVGAGPAGIASIGKLLDHGIDPKAINWIDPMFKTGDFGTLWRHVNSNTPVQSFIKFYENCASFNFTQKEQTFFIEKMPPEKNCPLKIAAQPLHWMTEHLKGKVVVTTDVVAHLKKQNNFWDMNLQSKKNIRAAKVILAIGAEAKKLAFPTLPVISLATALDIEALKQAITPEDYITVFGSSQSAKSVLESLKNISAKKIVLLYRTENTFERHLNMDQFPYVEAMPATPDHLLIHIPKTTKAIYAVGFTRRHIPIEGLPEDYHYDRTTGIIAPGIFGVGIAFPEIRPYELGQIDYKLSAIWPFMKRLDKLLPQWMKHS